MKRLFASILVILLLVAGAASQQSAPAPSAPAKPATPEFLATADEVLNEVSSLISLPVKAPLKKTLRSRDEIRDYVIREMKEEREKSKWYADQKALEKFGLLPRGFELERFLVDLFTEQIAGLYDPKSKEFYIADWIALGDQRMVMAHELVHALHDQHFDIQAWSDAARPNDDAELARHSFLEGAAIAGMLEYMLRAQNLRMTDLPDVEQLMRAGMVGDMAGSPELARAPAFIRDAMLFPYLAGTSFAQHLLRANGAWEGLHRVFARPPASTHEILHPHLYLNADPLPPISLSDAVRAVPAPWKKLDENTMGEFGLHAVLKQFLGEPRARTLSPAWAGDAYAVFENPKTKRVLLLFRLRLSAADDAARLFGNYSEALELKYSARTGLFRRPNFFSFESDEGGVFLYCRADECLTVEGSSRELFDKIVRGLGWPAAPRRALPAKQATKVASLPFISPHFTSQVPSSLSAPFSPAPYPLVYNLRASRM